MNYANVFKKEVREIIEQKDLKLDLLSWSQIFGDEKLKIFEKQNIQAFITDFAHSSGGELSPRLDCWELLDYFSISSGIWLTKTINVNKTKVCAINFCGNWYSENIQMCCSGIRPIVPYSSILNICSNEVLCDNILKVEFGEYPQWIVNKELSVILEELYQNNQIAKTGKSYTIYTRDSDIFDIGFELEKYNEYEYNGKKYVRVKTNFCSSKSNREIFSNGYSYDKSDYIWISVSPIKWLVDKESNIAVTEYIIVSGIQFSYIEKYMDEFLSKEILPYELYKKNMQTKKTNINIQNEITLSSALKEAENEMNEILEDTPYQKIKK